MHDRAVARKALFMIWSQKSGWCFLQFSSYGLLHFIVSDFKISLPNWYVSKYTISSLIYQNYDTDIYIFIYTY